MRVFERIAAPLAIKHQLTRDTQVDEMTRQERARAVTRATAVGALANIILSAVKIVAGWFGHSHALIADGVHSLSDLASDALVWTAGRKAAQAPDEQHPYGHGRYETMATLALGVLLVLVAIGIGWDATHRLFSPEALLRPEPITLYAALASIAVKEWLYWYTLAYAKRVGSDMLRANAWHHRSDAISSIVVLIGIAGTLAGLPYLDAVASVVVAVMIAKIAWELGWDATRELVDTGLDAGRLDAMRRTIFDVGGVRDIHMLRTRTLGGVASADVHVLVDPFISVSEGHLISVMVEQKLKREIAEIGDVVVHIDPEDDDSAPPTMNLPSRRGVLERLDELWSDIPEFASRKRVLLHYLNGRIEVDLFLPLNSASGAGAHPEALRDRLRSSLASDPVFSDVNLYFG
ncbi:MAG: cation diffusion facilitator family transporter [Thiohalocapsa sp.]